MIHAITAVGEPGHITAADDGLCHAGFIGAGVSIMVGIGNDCAISMSSANTVRIASGLMCVQGRWVRFIDNTEATVENGTAGQYRKDAIFLRRTIDDTGIEVYELMVERGVSAGTASAAVAPTPEFASNTMFDMSDDVDVVIGTVTLSGINATAAFLSSVVMLKPYKDRITDEINDGAKKTHKHVPANIVPNAAGALYATESGGTASFGKLPVSLGGTNRTTTAAGAMYATSAGGSLLMGALPVAQGGTGATAHEDARANLKAAARGWTQIASISGTSSATIDTTGYYEFIVVGHNGSAYSYLSSCIIPSGQLTDTAKEVYIGGGWSEGGNRKGCAKLSKTKFTGVQMIVDGTTLTSSAAWRLYAR